MSELYNFDEFEYQDWYKRLQKLTKKYMKLYGWLNEWHDALEDAENPYTPGGMFTYMRRRSSEDFQLEQKIMDLAIELGEVPNDGVGVTRKRKKHD